MPILTLLIFLPLFFAILISFLKDYQVKEIKWLSIISAILQFSIVVFLVTKFNIQSSGYQFIEEHKWITFGLGSLGKIQINYLLGVDGLSIGLITLSAIIMLIATISSSSISQKYKGYYVLIQLLSASIYGCFLSLDLFLFFIFFEFMLLPMFFLIGIWGGIRREYASIKFFLYTLVGSLLILLVIVGLSISVVNPAETAVNVGLIKDVVLFDDVVASKFSLLLHTDLRESGNLFVHSADIRLMSDPKNFAPNSIFSLTNDMTIFGLHLRLVGFLLLLIGFLVKLPAFPFHTWLPDAHVEAPTPISVILAGVLLKIGSYGLIRFAYGIFPEGAHYFAFYVALIGVISIIYAALNALAMKDLKKMIAYSSVSHMGFILLGLASLSIEGVNGAIIQQFSHGIIAAMLFLIVGVLYERTHNRDIENYRGLASKMPQYVTLTVIAFFASLGLPGFSGFIAEIFVFLGAFNSYNSLIPKYLVVIATLGLLLGAAYYLWTLQRMYFGKYWLRGGQEWNLKMTDLTIREKLVLIPLAIITIYLGVYPQQFIDFSTVYVHDFVNYVTHTGLENLILINKVIK